VNDLPKRSDPIYKEIESFEDYEITQCVAYEMAIRNDKNINLVNEIVNYFNLYKKKIFNLIKKNNSEELNRTNYDYSKEYKTIYKLMSKLELIDLHKYYGRAEYDYSISFGSDFNDIVQKIRIHEDKLNVYSDEIVTKNEITKRNGYQIYTEIHEHKNNYYSGGISIVAYFKRPPLKFDAFKSIKADTKIDITKPLDEIIAYVSHVKKDMELNSDILKAPIEYLNQTLQRADDISKMCTENRNGTLKCFDGRKGLKRTEKLADMFFIYDMIKACAKKSKILFDLDEYYDPEYKKQTSFHSDTYDKYLLVAKDYIDNGRYKELATGVKT